MFIAIDWISINISKYPAKTKSKLVTLLSWIFSVKSGTRTTISTREVRKFTRVMLFGLYLFWSPTTYKKKLGIKIFGRAFLESKLEERRYSKHVDKLIVELKEKYKIQ